MRDSKLNWRDRAVIHRPKPKTKKGSKGGLSFCSFQLLEKFLGQSNGVVDTRPTNVEEGLVCPFSEVRLLITPTLREDSRRSGSFYLTGLGP